MYSANIALVSDDVLKIQGCVLGGIFCGGENWTRVQPVGRPAPLAKDRATRLQSPAQQKPDGKKRRGCRKFVTKNDSAAFLTFSRGGPMSAGWNSTAAAHGADQRQGQQFSHARRARMT